MLNMAVGTFGFGVGVEGATGACVAGTLVGRGILPDGPDVTVAVWPVACRGSLCGTPGTRRGTTTCPVDLIVGVARGCGVLACRVGCATHVGEAGAGIE